METEPDGYGLLKIDVFTFHTGQMETSIRKVPRARASSFTFHTGQMETIYNAWDGYLIRGSHSTQVRWRHLEYIVKGIGNYKFTFHTGQMETYVESLFRHPQTRVHIPHRSDGDTHSGILLLWQF